MLFLQPRNYLSRFMYDANTLYYTALKVFEERKRYFHPRLFESREQSAIGLATSSQGQGSGSLCVSVASLNVLILNWLLVARSFGPSGGYQASSSWSINCYERCPAARSPALPAHGYILSFMAVRCRALLLCGTSFQRESTSSVPSCSQDRILPHRGDLKTSMFGDNIYRFKIVQKILIDYRLINFCEFIPIIESRTWMRMAFFTPVINVDIYGSPNSIIY